MDKHHVAWLERHADRDEAWRTAKLREGFDIHHLDRTPQGVQHHDELAGRIPAPADQCFSNMLVRTNTLRFSLEIISDKFEDIASCALNLAEKWLLSLAHLVEWGVISLWLSPNSGSITAHSSSDKSKRMIQALLDSLIHTKPRAINYFN